MYILILNHERVGEGGQRDRRQEERWVQHLEVKGESLRGQRERWSPTVVVKMSKLGIRGLVLERRKKGLETTSINRCVLSEAGTRYDEAAHQVSSTGA